MLYYCRCSAEKEMRICDGRFVGPNICGGNQSEIEEKKHKQN